MYKYLILHIPTGTYVSRYNLTYTSKNGSSWASQWKVTSGTCFGDHVEHTDEPVYFLSKTRAKLWLRQNKVKANKNHFEIIEVIE